MTSITDIAKMFIHTGENLPQDPDYPADLAKLGYEVNKEKQIVSISPEQHFFTFFHTSSVRANEIRKEAMHESVRGLVMMELADLGVVQVYLGGDKGKEILGVGAEGKLKEKHLPILATKLEELKGKRDVVVVIGEPTEDLGIWAWRHLMTDGGIEGGSAVGLVKKLAVLGMDSTEIVYKEEMKRKKEEMGLKAPASMPPTASGHGSDATTTTHRDSLTASDKSKVPGVIILNPGALIWSNMEKHTMTVPTWLARKGLNALGEDFVVDPIHNRVEGHTEPYEHIETCMDFILPQILAQNAHLYIVGITNSAEYFINWYQARQCTVGTPHTNHSDVPGTTKMLNAMAFMQPTHDATKIKCDTVEIMLHDRGRQWIKSSKPLGTFLNTVKPTELPALPSFPAPRDADKRAEDDVLRLPDYNSAFTETGTALNLYSGNETATKADQAGKSNLEEPIAGDAPVEIAMPAALASPAEKADVVSLDSLSSANPADRFLEAEGKISAAPSEGESEASGPRTAAAALPAQESALGSSASALAAPRRPVFELEDEDETGDEGRRLSYDHRREIVSCATYSGATDVDEMIWPNVMDLALGHFKFVAEKTARPWAL